MHSVQNTWLLHICFFFLITLLIASVNKGQAVSVDCEVLTKALLDSTKCYLLDCGCEIYVWMGRETALEDRKRAGLAAEVRLMVDG
jgi:gelsolin